MSPSNKFSIVELTIISSLVGQISFKKTGLPSFEVPGDEDRKWRNLERSKFKSYNNGCLKVQFITTQEHKAFSRLVLVQDAHTVVGDNERDA